MKYLYLLIALTVLLWISIYITNTPALAAAVCSIWIIPAIVLTIIFIVDTRTYNMRK